MQSPTPSDIPEILTAQATVVMAGATIVLAVGTLALAYAALRQLPLVAKQLAALNAQLSAAKVADEAADQRHRDLKDAEDRRQIETLTLQACTKYDTDPILYGCCRRIWDGSNKGQSYSKETVSPHDVITVSNYLDGIATGVLQGLYSSDIAKDHVGPFIYRFITIIIPKILDDSIGYEAMIKVKERWYPASATVAYNKTHE